MPESQSDVVAFLQSPDGFAEGPVETIETHGAFVFLCGGTALKLKRAVKYDYMDLSTPERRKAMLERELELNLPAAPAIYRDVLPVTRGVAGLKLGGGGTPVDWVLRMHRFPAGDELEQVVARGGFDDRLATETGQMVQRYHAAAPLRDRDGAVLIGDILDELQRVFGEFTGLAGTEQVGDWLGAARAALASVAPLLSWRGHAGHIRRGHGDLHLRNLVLIGGRPVPFDALEFDETLGTCDVLYDLAFLLMDLRHRGLDRAATVVLDAYLLAARGVEDAGLAALPLFIAVRGAIRAMVLLQTDRARRSEGGSTAEIRLHLAGALKVLRPVAPAILAVGGLSGSGKSVLARNLAPGLGAAPGAVHLSTDAERKAAAGVAGTARLAGEAYAAAARADIYDHLMTRAEAILRAGYSVVLDGTFLDPLQRRKAEQLGRRLDVPLQGFWLQAPVGILRERIARRHGDASDADAEVLCRQLQADPGPIGWTRLDAAGPPEEVLAAARQVLAAARGEGGSGGPQGGLPLP